MCIIGLFRQLDDCQHEFLWCTVTRVLCLDLKYCLIAIGFFDIVLGVFGAVGISFFIYDSLRSHEDEFWIVGLNLMISIGLFFTGRLTLITAFQQTPYRVNYTAELHFRTVLTFAVVLLLSIVLRSCFGYYTSRNKNAILVRFVIPGNSSGIGLYSFFTMVANGFRVRYLRSERMRDGSHAAIYL